MIILGIDPGSLVLGYGIIEVDTRSQKLLTFGELRPKGLFSKKGVEIFSALENLIEEFQPDVCSVETQFVQKNPKGALTLGMVRGFAILAAARAQVPIYEYAPSRVKSSVCSRGHATKDQVKKMVSFYLKISEDSLGDDASDALAIALCHAHMSAGALSKGAPI